MRWLPERGPARLDFEFGPARGRLRPAAILLWVIALAFAGDVASSYARTYELLRSRTAQLAGASPVARAFIAPKGKDLEREVAFARSTIFRIALPWNDLFRALGASSMESVSLLSIEPDVDAGVVQITGRAENIPAMLDYVSRLESNAQLPSVALASHEIKGDDPDRPISFAVKATWNNRR